MEPTDLELLRAWTAGDNKAGEALFSRHFRDIRSFFRSKIANASTQEDLIQETFLQACKSAGSFRGESLFRTFLFTIARRTLCDHLRKRDPAMDPASVGQSSMADLEPGPSSLLVKHRDEQRLVHALREIPLDDQTIIELFYWQDLPAREVAEIMDMPEGTVRSRLKRAKDALARKLERQERSPADLSTSQDNIDAWLRSVRDQL